MNLVRLIYCSESAGAISFATVQDIIRIAEIKNPLNQITGFLCFVGTYFIQAIEGPAPAVNQLFANFHRDRRHKSVTLLDYRGVTAREFPNWAMGAVLAKDKQELLCHYATKENFHPPSMSADQALDLLTKLAQARTESDERHGRLATWGQPGMALS